MTEAAVNALIQSKDKFGDMSDILYYFRRDGFDDKPLSKTSEELKKMSDLCDTGIQCINEFDEMKSVFENIFNDIRTQIDNVIENFNKGKYSSKDFKSECTGITNTNTDINSMINLILRYHELPLEIKNG
jgi:hypothetical protein